MKKARKEMREEEEGQSEEEGEPQHQHQHKKAKKMQVVEEEDEDYQEEEEEEKSEHVSRARMANGAAQVEEHGEDDDDEGDFQRRRTQNAQSGIIDTIECKNFMNRAHFRVRMNPNVSWITGPNGSGKSCILHAIQICLGEKAKATSRATKLSDFIRRKDNQDGDGGAIRQYPYAEVMVTLWNEGPMAHKPEVYGRRIRVVRKIKLKSSTLCVEGAVGEPSRSGEWTFRKVSGKPSEELALILAAFHIKISSPVLVMTQDMCREFITHQTPESLFKLFMQTSRLSDMQEQASSVLEALQGTSSKITIAADAIDTYDEKLQAAKAALEETKSLQNAEKELAMSLNAIMYVQVRDQRKATAKAEKTLKRVREERDKAVLKRDAAQKKQEVYEAEMTTAAEQVNEEIKEVEAEINEDRKKNLVIEKEVRTLQAEASGFHHTIAGIQKAKKKLMGRIKENEAQIDEAHAKANSNTLVEKQRKMEAGLEVLLSKRVALEKQATELNDKLDNTHGKSQAIEAELGRVQRRRGDIESDLASIKSVKESPINTWGTYSARIIEVIKRNQHHFDGPVYGPIGQYISVKDPNHEAAVVSTLREEMLKAYAVGTHRDRVTLSQILRKICPKERIQIFVSAHNRARIRPKHAHFAGGHPLLCDVYKVEPDFVWNLLIDQKSTDMWLMGSDVQQSIDLIQRHPQERFRGLLLTQNGIVKKIEKVGRNGSYKSVPMRRSRMRLNTARPSSAANAAEEARRLQAELVEVRRQEKQVLSDQAQHIRDSKTLAQNAKKVKQILSKVKDDAEAMESVLAGIKETMEDEEGTVEDAVYKAEIERNQELIAQKDESIAEAAKKLAEVREAIADHKERLVGDKSKATKQSRMAALSKKLEELDDRRRANIHGLAKLNAQISKADKQLAEGKTIVEDERRKLVDAEAFYAKEMDGCPEDEVPNLEQITYSAKEAEERALRRKAAYEKVKDNYGDVDCRELEHAVLVAKKERNEAKAQLAHAKNARSDLAASYNNRIAEMKHFRDALRSKTSKFFREFLKSRGHNGELVFNFQKETLDIRCSMDGINAGMSSKKKRKKTSGQAKFGSSASHLSGGQRAFATLCFIFSLAEASDSPFRCMDEFDVFMDDTARADGLRLAQWIGNYLRHRQFILLTPHSLKGITGNENVTIHHINKS